MGRVSHALQDAHCLERQDCGAERADFECRRLFDRLRGPRAEGVEPRQPELITGCEEVVERFGEKSSQLHLTRNNVFSLAAFEAAYSTGEAGVDDLLGLITRNIEQLRSRLPERVELCAPQATDQLAAAAQQV